MYPELYNFSIGDSTIPIMTFGVCLTLAFALFYWMLYRLGKKYQINTAFFTVNLLSFFLVTFFTARLLHVFLYLGIPTKSAFLTDYPFWSFLLTPDFYFSFGGALVGFLAMFYYRFMERDVADRDDALDITVISGLFASIVGYIGAFFGGQTYGIKSEGLFSVDYYNNFILADFPRFPLAIFYAFFLIFIFSFCYIIKKLRPERGLAAGVGALLFGIMWFIGEWWNDASADNFAYLFGLLTDWKLFNFNQLLSVCFICWGSWKVATIIPSPISDWILWVADRFFDWYEPLEKHVQKTIKKLRKKWFK